MVLHLSRILDVPLRRRNDLLVAAGLAPEYPTTGLGDEAMASVRQALTFILDATEPFPALVVDRLWNLLMANSAAMRLTPLLVDPAKAPVDGGVVNLLHLTMHPDGLRRSIVNFDEVARAIIERVTREAMSDPTDTELADLLESVLQYPEIPEPGQPRASDGGLLIPIHYRTEDLDLRLFTTISVIGTPHDTTLAEIRIETLMPADAATAQALRELAR